MRERPWRRFEGYAVVLVFGGRGAYRDVTGREEEIGPGDVIVVSPGFAHWYGPPDGSRWSEMFVVFDGPAFDLLAAAGVISTERPVLRGRGGGDWMERLAAVVGAPAPRGAGHAMTELWTFSALLLELLSESGDGATEAADPIARGARLLQGDLGARLALRDVAGQVGMSYERFRHRFTDAIGSSPARYRDAHRIAAARELLRHTEMTHRQIAGVLGFADEFHFSKRFRQLSGDPPSAFRRAVRSHVS